MGCIVTASGNTIHLEDKEDSERILIDCPRQDSLISIGATADSLEEEEEETEKEGVTIKTEKDLDMSVGGEYTLDAEEDSESHFHEEYVLTVEGDYEQHTHGEHFELTKQIANEMHLGEKSETTIGTMTKAHLANVNEVVLGLLNIEIDIALKLLFEGGGKWSFGPEFKELRASRAELILSEEEIEGIRELMVADELGLLGETNITNVNRNVVNLDLTNATLNFVQVVAAQNDMMGERAGIIAENNAIGAEENRIVALINQM